MNVPPGGYAWWYVDAVSVDGAHALTIIAFIGSVFSPYYAWSGRSSPLDHCALNVALYSPGAQRWTMTERSAKRVALAPHRFAIARSALDWDGETLTIRVDERAAPAPRRVKGVVKVRAPMLGRETFAIDHEGRHRWRPLAPIAHVEAAFEAPALTWSGAGYFDTNDGDEPIEDAFTNWHWARLHGDDGKAMILYDTAPREGAARALALSIDPSGAAHRITPRAPEALPSTAIWRMPRRLAAEEAGAAAVLRTLEDAPFYSRSLVETTLDGKRRRGVHESLSGDRLKAPWVRMLLPFRMPRTDL